MKKQRFVITYTKFGSEEFIFDCYEETIVDALIKFTSISIVNEWEDVDIIKIEKGKMYHD